MKNFKSLDIETHDHKVIPLASLTSEQSNLLHSQGYQFWLIECPDMGVLSVYGLKSDLELAYTVLSVGSDTATLVYIIDPTEA
ncbi:MAG: hypothetical protein GY905_14980 [Gammaproteobacteria bacterium]|jgi:hypothetical protein|nr:hypothetical protein [Gammaproteobacteria bacterium]